jgi:hypothetical protein
LLGYFLLGIQNWRVYKAKKKRKAQQRTIQFECKKNEHKKKYNEEYLYTKEEEKNKIRYNKG